MLRNIGDLLGRAVEAIDGEIGEVKGFYFDDRAWVVRYITVDAGSWLSSKEVVIAPSAFKNPLWHSENFPVYLRKDQIENSPLIDPDSPITRDEEIRIIRHYGWPAYWESDSLYQRLVTAAGTAVKTALLENRPATHLLRSTKRLFGSTVTASDGEVGKLLDFVADDISWEIHYMVVESGSWLSGKKVLLAPEWVENADWDTPRLSVGMTREVIKDSPAYDPAYPITRIYENRLYDYYQVPKYWRRY
jgi:hypothetical protein